MSINTYLARFVLLRAFPSHLPPPPPLRMSMSPVSRPSRFRVQYDTVFETVHTMAQLAKDITDIANVPFASQAASLVLSMLEIAKGVQDNNDVRVRLATTAATYLVELRPILDSQNALRTTPPELRIRLDRFHRLLLDSRDCLEAMKKRSIIKHVFGKARISARLLDLEKALQDSYNALLMWTVANTYIIVRKAEDIDGDIPQYDQAQVILKGSLKVTEGFFSHLDFADVNANGTCQPVLVKRFTNKTERDKEAKKWRKLWHANIPQLTGCSSDRSAMQFILFHDAYVSRNTGQFRSIAAFLVEMTRSEDVFYMVNKMVDFLNDAISAVRHMQAMLNLDENETADLAWITKYTVSCDGRIIVVPPLQDLSKFGDGVSNSIYSRLIPSLGTSEASMRRYLGTLDSVPTHAALATALNGEYLDKWSSLESITEQLHFTPKGIEKPRQYVMPESRWALIDYSVDIKPGDFGVLVPGQEHEYAFQRLDNPVTNDSVLFSHQSWYRFYDRNVVDFEVACDHPMTWGLDRLTDGSVFTFRRAQRLVYRVHQSKRFLQLSVPVNCKSDELIFITYTQRCHNYKYALRSDLSQDSSKVQVAPIFAELQNSDEDELRFSHCMPSDCPDSCGYPLDNRVSVWKNNEFMRINYVTIPVKKRAAGLQSSAKRFENKVEARLLRYWEYESILQSQTQNEVWFWAEWF